MKKALALAAVLTGLWAAPAQAMTVQEFLTSANRIPRNPTALLRSDTRRLMNEVKAAFAAIRAEQTAAQTAGRRPLTCIPEGTKISLSADQLISKLNAVPPSRRTISVKQALQEAVAKDFPCTN